MVALQDALLLRREAEPVARGENRVDAAEQGIVEIDLAAMAREQGETSRSIASSASLVSAPVRLKNTDETLCKA